MHGIIICRFAAMLYAPNPNVNPTIWNTFNTHQVICRSHFQIIFSIEWCYFNANLTQNCSFLRVYLIMNQYRFRQWLGADEARNHYQWWPSLLTHICVTWGQWVRINSTCKQTKQKLINNNEIDIGQYIFYTIQLLKQEGMVFVRWKSKTHHCLQQNTGI